LVYVETRQGHSTDSPSMESPAISRMMLPIILFKILRALQLGLALTANIDKPPAEAGGQVCGAETELSSAAA
ncbi:hypothetical protein, partial [Comamonas thiooxydans]